MQRKQPDPAPLLRIPETDSTRARDFLDRIPAADADDYDTWVKVGMALHSAGDDSLLQDWIHWSTISGKFEPGICEAKWKHLQQLIRWRQPWHPRAPRRP
jgi:hypothetical protein